MKYYSGKGLVNSLINNLPFELHIPGYSYCGPGTKLQERLARGSQPINELDRSCQEHDIFYHNEKDTKQRHKADKILANAAMQRFHSQDASLGEKLAALGIAGTMKAKVKLGMGLNGTKKINYRNNMKKCIKILEKTKSTTETSLKNLQDAIRTLKGENIINNVPQIPRKIYKLPKKNSTTIRKKRKDKIQPMDTEDVERELQKNEPIDLNMNLNLNRKRKIDDGENISSNKKSNIIPINHNKFQRKIHRVQRKRLSQEDPSKILKEPISNTLKRKLENTSDVEEEEDFPKEKKVKI